MKVKINLSVPPRYHLISSNNWNGVGTIITPAEWRLSFSSATGSRRTLKQHWSQSVPFLVQYLGYTNYDVVMKILAYPLERQRQREHRQSPKPQ